MFSDSEDYGKSFHDISYTINSSFIRKDFGISVGPGNSKKVCDYEYHWVPCTAHYTSWPQIGHLSLMASFLSWHEVLHGIKKDAISSFTSTNFVFETVLKIALTHWIWKWSRFIIASLLTSTFTSTQRILLSVSVFLNKHINQISSCSVNAPTNNLQIQSLVSISINEVHWKE